jgi:hypothetical protein
MSKQSQIWTYLLEGNTLTQEQARTKFNHWRLASVVQRLRDKGVHVAAHLVGDTKHAVYHCPKSGRDAGKYLLRELKGKDKVRA